MRPARIAVDVGIGRAGARLLRAVGHEVVVEAEWAETDRSWFARAITAQAQVIVSPDIDLEILAYDANLMFFRHRHGDAGLVTAQRFIRWWLRHLRRAA